MNGEKAWEQNNMFEFNVMMHWLAFRPPAKVCISWKGIFTHHVRTSCIARAADCVSNPNPPKLHTDGRKSTNRALEIA